MPTPVITVSQMREWEDATWASGQSQESVILQAGRAVARFAESVSQPDDSILVLAGRGHNGDDARHAAALLEHRRVEILNVSDPKIDLVELKLLLNQGPALIVDGLFGIGLNRPLSADWSQFLQTLNQARRPVLAVDVPSGLDADQGMPVSKEAVRATWTLTLGAVKRGLLLASAWPFVGRLELASNIGLIPCPFTSDWNWVHATDFAGFPPPRPITAHKGSFGHVFILAGSLGYHGAAVLAARAAHRAQPGLVTLCTPSETYIPVASQLQATMVQPWKTGLKLPPACTAVLIGPGLAAPRLPKSMITWARHVWKKSTMAVIVDASGLDWLPEGKTPPQAIRVITPHPGEAARLLDWTSTRVLAQRDRAIQELSGRWGGCRVALKGHQTLTGRKVEPLFYNSSGNPFLAQGGSGDVLAGFLAGLLAQPVLQADPALAVRYAVWQHGATADDLQKTIPNWTPEDLVTALGPKPPPR